LKLKSKHLDLQSELQKIEGEYGIFKVKA